MRKLVNALKGFASEKKAAMTIEYVTIASIGAVLAMLFMYEIMGGDDGNSGVAGLVDALSGELDAAATSIEGAVSEEGT